MRYGLDAVARILVVDDDSQFRRVLRIALTASGHQVCEAANGFEALSKVRASPLDLVLLDWQMPGMAGEETCRAMRRFSRAPIIVVSALDRSREAAAYGLDGSLTKPVEIDVLLGRIDSALRH